MKLENFLIKSIKEDLYNLLNQYIADSDCNDEISDLENEIISLDDMTLEELINKNLEYVHNHEMKAIISEYVGHWFDLNIV